MLRRKALTRLFARYVEVYAHAFRTGDHERIAVEGEFELTDSHTTESLARSLACFVAYARETGSEKLCLNFIRGTIDIEWNGNAPVFHQPPASVVIETCRQLAVELGPMKPVPATVQVSIGGELRQLEFQASPENSRIEVTGFA